VTSTRPRQTGMAALLCGALQARAGRLCSALRQVLHLPFVSPALALQPRLGSTASIPCCAFQAGSQLDVQGCPQTASGAAQTHRGRTNQVAENQPPPDPSLLLRACPLTRQSALHAAASPHPVGPSQWWVLPACCLPHQRQHHPYHTAASRHAAGAAPLCYIAP
jgi:hypothetical protein